MINFFKNKKKVSIINSEYHSKIASLLIHAAKIDESYTKKEEEIIKKTLIEMGVESANVDKLISDAVIIEENSNQILNFTKEIKNAPESDKLKVVESLWKIIYSDNSSDMYESNLMRRLTNLIYVDSITMGELKEKIKKNLSK
jgi:uncharacterized tellurite resistance protein B-like protein|tara:strand:- start:107 stop:535 length:429 start_codon:yes stop_codon:yes gene_type:complete